MFLDLPKSNAEMVLSLEPRRENLALTGTFSLSGLSSKVTSDACFFGIGRVVVNCHFVNFVTKSRASRGQVAGKSRETREKN